MNSRAWTDSATGAKAKSVRRWMRRRASPILVRYLVLLALLGVAALIFGELLVSETYRDPHRCYPDANLELQCAPDPVRLGDIF
jgi:hypothetical protein